LRELSLKDNPIASDPAYKDTILRMFPHLKRLDDIDTQNKIIKQKEKKDKRMAAAATAKQQKLLQQQQEGNNEEEEEDGNDEQASSRKRPRNDRLEEEDEEDDSENEQSNAPNAKKQRVRPMGGFDQVVIEKLVPDNAPNTSTSQHKRPIPPTQQHGNMAYINPKEEKQKAQTQGGHVERSLKHSGVVDRAKHAPKNVERHEKRVSKAVEFLMQDNEDIGGGAW